MPKSLFDTLAASEIGEFNTSLKRHLHTCFGVPEGDDKLNFRFDEPNYKDASINSPTFHLFMYLIHEDLAIRHSSPTAYLPQSGQFEPDRAFIRCLYLVTYWEPPTKISATSPQAEPDSDSVKNHSTMIRALLKLRKNSAFKKYQLRIIEPEALNSLGNFWQALGDKPRTILNFAVTMPVVLDDIEAILPVKKVESTFEQLSGHDQLRLEQALYAELAHKLPGGALARVTVRAAPALTTRRKKAGEPVQEVDVGVAGLVLAEQAKQLEETANGWAGNTFDLAGTRWLVKKVDLDGLVQVPEKDEEALPTTH
ncbi:Pvc16 family protein [Pantoea sp. A4]|uniref:Pvc16 family protein n=1 Tax=Pantoea sp. A4 TaxID=1225184 RepID=UPI00037525D8|nr:Pvc16 family protein [Pantoea sp. A4]